MAISSDPRVAVYIDFDNIVISRYDQVHGRNAWRSDNARLERPTDAGAVAAKLREAIVDVGAVLDYASSFGTVAVTRAYADWSVPANASYRTQLVDRAVDLTQLFPTTKALKNGADIRLSVDVLEDLFRLPDLTHVVIVAGDSDYIALAQRCKRLGRFVVGIGVAGGTSPALIAACDEFELYDAIPKSAEDEPETAAAADVSADLTEETAAGARSELSDLAATRLLVRALELGQTKGDDEWVNASAVKSQMRRINPSFNEKLLGFSSFSDFVRSRNDVAEVQIDGLLRHIRLRPAEQPPKDETPTTRRGSGRRAARSASGPSA
ncbi:NYN domain-containing protein [Lysobacter korlensis]|uniref:NYN domain-containing protein n=1 Tax=Lysobacter korlensis TaxID=553636 RepID=A0ABV6RN27_9GAMM